MCEGKAKERAQRACQASATKQYSKPNVVIAHRLIYNGSDGLGTHVSYQTFVVVALSALLPF